MKSPVATYTRKGNVHTIDFGVPAMGKIVIDFDAVPEDQRTGISKALLSASLCSCYANTLAEALDAREANVTEITTQTDLVLGENANKQGRVTGAEINTKVEISQEDADTFERIQKIMRNGCFISGSVHEGVHMDYNLNAEFKE